MTEIMTTKPQSFPIGSINTTVAITVIITIGICYCATIAVNAKYNRNTEITYGEAPLKISLSAPISTTSA